jgi:hypothetical protein
MFEFIHDDKYDIREALLELKKATREYQEARWNMMVKQRANLNAMRDFEIATANDLVTSGGQLLNADNIRMTGVLKHPELRNRWVMADADSIDATAQMEVAKATLDAVMSAVNALAKT